MRFILIKKRTLCIILAGVFIAFTGTGFAVTRAAKAAAQSDTATALPILMYHSVLKDPAAASRYVISPDTFRSDMRYLKANGYTTVFLSEVCDFVLKGTPLPAKPVVVTFDDGYLNNLTYILPIVEELDIKAVISVVGEFSQRYTDTDDPNPAYAHLTWDDIKLLADSGHIEIGNHTYSMHSTSPRKGCTKLRSESEEEYLRVLSGDLGKLQDKLKENCGITPIIFAYPFGYMNESSISVLKQLGFTCALTCAEKVNYLNGSPEQLFRLCRFNRPAGISTESFMKRIED